MPSIDQPYFSKFSSSISQAHPIASAPSSQSDEIWSKILQDVSSKNNNETQGSVIFLGDSNSGKSTLVERMTAGATPTDYSHVNNTVSSVLEYNFLVVHASADYDAGYAYQLGGSTTGLGPADTVNLPLWTLDGTIELAPLLRFAFPAQLAKCTVVFCASMDRPAAILPTLAKWYRIFSEQVHTFYSADEIEQARQMQLRLWQEYVEPLESSLHMESASRLEIDPVLLPPEKGVLDENCGASVVVILTKSDLHADLGSDVNKVQYYVRRFCLRHGAALIYTSAKEDKNVKLLNKYLAHRVYSLPFTYPAYIVENDSIFIPSGWDSEQKLAIVYETIADPNDPLQQEDTTSSQLGSARGPAGTDQVVEVEDEQLFLQRLHVILQEMPANGASGVTPSSSSASILNAGSTPGGLGMGITPKRSAAGDLSSMMLGVSSSGGALGSVSALSGSASAGKNLAAQGASSGDSTTLASFFNSLLKKDSGSSTTPKTSLGSAADMEAHLQKVLNQRPTTVIKEAGGDAQAVVPSSVPPLPPQAVINDDETTAESDISSAGSARTPRDAEA